MRRGQARLARQVASTTCAVREEGQPALASQDPENKGDMKKLWRTFRGVLGDADLDVPDDHTADDFATFFQDKVDVVTSFVPPPLRRRRTMFAGVTLKHLVTGLLLQLTKLLN